MITLHITGRKKQSEERAALFAVRVNVVVMFHLEPTSEAVPFLTKNATDAAFGDSLSTLAQCLPTVFSAQAPN